MATPDPTKHNQGYGRRDPATGMLHGPIHYPDGRPPVPSGCRWCGQAENAHAPFWRPGKGFHRYEQPTTAQILARMRARRAARLNTLQTEYHATTNWEGDHHGEPVAEYCADCGRDDCPRWLRIQKRLDEQRLNWLPWPSYADAYPDERPF